jgi:hypothetical protein
MSKKETIKTAERFLVAVFGSQGDDESFMASATIITAAAENDTEYLVKKLNDVIEFSHSLIYKLTNGERV